MEYKSFLNATADQHFFDGSNARWVGFYSRQMPHYVEPNRGQMPGGYPGGGGGGGDDRAWN